MKKRIEIVAKEVLKGKVKKLSNRKVYRRKYYLGIIKPSFIL